ncbi:hypothetical protein BN1723_014348 [Verticillium longisporum]|uniref:NB-ARC domain-containing protein n=1 Tax=Verticillium longisporum TaxID=100787 RepID=A0A0G4M7K0_VERLO|nr:hypothetical protein BN1723_014348 [Verticillium longisporum]
MAKVHRIGFTRLDTDVGKKGRHTSNIIFVHGLRGHPLRTWGDDEDNTNADHASSFLRATFRKWRGKSRHGASEDTLNTHDAAQRHPFWPRDLLADDLPNARIWTYGYNADAVEGMFGATNKNSVSQHGRDFAIKFERKLDDQEPIIFVAHSLGGIIVKDALSRSETLQQRTAAIVFLGTPHRGSSAADWAQLASNMAAVAFLDSNKQVTGALKVDSEVLGNVHEQFVKIAMKRGIRLHSFQEGRGISGVRGISGKIVGDFSSSLGLPDEKIESIDADHRQMVKCTDRDDSRYGDIRDVLKQFLGSGAPASLSLDRVGSAPSPSHAQTRETTVGGTLAQHQPQSGPCFLVPFPENKRFVGRTETLQRLEKMLFAGDIQKAAIVGLGGVGKTQVALQVAYWVKETKPDWSVYWLPALSMAGFEQACAEIARDLGLEGPSQDDPKELVRRYLCSAQSGRWFLIVDNADDMDLLLGTANSTGIHGYLPTNTHGRVLFTTRSTDVARAVVDDDFVELDKMSEQEARDFLQKLLSKDLTADDAAMGTLLRDLTYLPLAISQAAAYIKRNGIPISGYISLLRDTNKKATGLLSREFPDLTRYRESRHAVATTWLISFEEIRRMDKPAAELVSFMSQVEPRAIPQSMLPSLHTREELVHALGTLKGYAFLQEREDAAVFDMHGLVHLATRGWVQTQDVSREVHQAAVAHLATIFASDRWDQRETWRQYMAHVLRAINGAAGREDWGGEECELGFWVGRCLRAEGRIAEATEILAHVVAVQGRSLAEDHPSRLASQHELAIAYRANGQVEKAVEILAQMEAVRGSIHVE